MVKAELTHNPYLLETEILFNGRKPRINSLVEKYYKSALHEWIHVLPAIFYNEMNGFDFDLEFTGTKLDFQGLTKAFSDASVTNEMVHLYHKNLLDERNAKLEKIDRLLSWIRENRNRKFDYEEFWANNSDLFEGKYSFLVIQKRSIDASELNGPDVEVEYISNYNEIEHTDLHNTPILIFISEENRRDFQAVLKQLFSRADVHCNQLFFMTHARIDKDKAKRIVIDLGIENPQFITSFSDPKIHNYLDLYPRTECIMQAINLFRHCVNEIQSVLEAENVSSEIENRSIHNQIDNLDSSIMRLKNSLNCFVDRNNLEIPDRWLIALQIFKSRITGWRIKKTKVIGEDKGYEAAREYESEIRSAYIAYQQAIIAWFRELIHNLNVEYNNWYCKADMESDFSDRVQKECFDIPDAPEIPLLIDSFMTLKEEQYVAPKEDIFGMFFKSTSQEAKEPVLEISYYYQKWRDYAEEALTPLAEDFLSKCFESVKQFDQEVSSKYIGQLEGLIEKLSEEKSVVTENLSEDEKNLQMDNDWLSAFCDKLTDIERG